MPCHISFFMTKPQIKECFPDWTPKQFSKFFMGHHKCPADEIVNRIEFAYEAGK